MGLSSKSGAQGFSPKGSHQPKTKGVEKIGKIIDEKKALGKCQCFKQNPHQKDSKLICYSAGVVGTLSKEQSEQCKKKEIKPTPKTMQRHFEKFNELGAVTQVCLSSKEGQTTEDFYKCIGREANKQR